MGETRGCPRAGASSHHFPACSGRPGEARHAVSYFTDEVECVVQTAQPNSSSFSKYAVRWPRTIHRPQTSGAGRRPASPEDADWSPRLTLGQRMTSLGFLGVSKTVRPTCMNWEHPCAICTAGLSRRNQKPSELEAATSRSWGRAGHTAVGRRLLSRPLMPLLHRCVL